MLHNVLQVLRLHIGRDGKDPLVVKGKVLYSHPGEEPMFVTGFSFMPETHEERISVADGMAVVGAARCMSATS